MLSLFSLSLDICISLGKFHQADLSNKKMEQVFALRRLAGKQWIQTVNVPLRISVSLDYCPHFYRFSGLGEREASGRVTTRVHLVCKYRGPRLHSSVYYSCWELHQFLAFDLFKLASYKFTWPAGWQVISDVSLINHVHTVALTVSGYRRRSRWLCARMGKTVEDVW